MVSKISSGYYGYIYRTLEGWIESDKFKFVGRRTIDMPDDLDYFIFKLVGLPIDNPRAVTSVYFIKAVNNGDVPNPSWILGPYGLTLLKAKMIRDDQEVRCERAS